MLSFEVSDNSGEVNYHYKNRKKEKKKKTEVCRIWSKGRYIIISSIQIYMLFCPQQI